MYDVLSFSSKLVQSEKEEEKEEEEVVQQTLRRSGGHKPAHRSSQGAAIM